MAPNSQAVSHLPNKHCINVQFLMGLRLSARFYPDISSRPLVDLANTRPLPIPVSATHAHITAEPSGVTEAARQKKIARGSLAPHSNCARSRNTLDSIIQQTIWVAAWPGQAISRQSRGLEGACLVGASGNEREARLPWMTWARSRTIGG